MAKAKKPAKKGDKKKISALDSALDQTLSADTEAYRSAPSNNPPATSTEKTERAGEAKTVRAKGGYQKPVEFPRKVMALFTDGQYEELKTLVADLRRRDGKNHSLNSVIRDALARYIADFRHGK